MNLPNTLSILRIILSPVFLLLFISDNVPALTASFFIFTVAAVTDWYDGLYARKYGYKTRWGQFIDPLADKILTSSAFLGFYILEQKQPLFFGDNKFIPLWLLVIIIIFRDLILTAVRSYQELRGRNFRTSPVSKVKTFMQMTYIFLFIGCYVFSSLYPGSWLATAGNFLLHSEINYYILIFIVIITLLSGITYFFESGQENRI